MKFSQRIGKTSLKSVLQIESVDEDLKNALWNNITQDLLTAIDTYSRYGNSPLGEFYITIWKSFFKKPVDKIPIYRDRSNGDSVATDEVQGIIRQWYFKAQWYEIYDFIEFLSQNAGGVDSIFNPTLKRELSAYRLVNSRIMQITSEEEIFEIEEAINDTSKWQSVNTHLKTALSFISNRKSPNYRNSIKESISAVESLCVIITGDKKATLGKALSIIEKKYTLHKALKESFSSLYGYTSDASGIRHSLLENDIPIDFEEAKFMLVLCSAFINFLKSKFVEGKAMEND
jgi:hypothetical protein